MLKKLTTVIQSDFGGLLEGVKSKLAWWTRRWLRQKACTRAGKQASQSTRAIEYLDTICHLRRP